MITMIVPAAILRTDSSIFIDAPVEAFGSDHLIIRFKVQHEADSFRASYLNESECKASAATSHASTSANASVSATTTRAGSATDAANPAPRSSSCGTSYATATSHSNDGRMAHLTLTGDKLTGTLTGDNALGQAHRFTMGGQWHALPVTESYSITIPASHAPFSLVRTIAILARVKFSSEPRLVEGDKMFCVIKTQAEVIRFLKLIAA